MKEKLTKIAMILIGSISIAWAFSGNFVNALLSIIILLLWLIYERLCKR